MVQRTQSLICIQQNVTAYRILLPLIVYYKRLALELLRQIYDFILIYGEYNFLLLIQANEHAILNTLILLVCFDYRIVFLPKAIDGVRVSKKKVTQFMAVNLEIDWTFLSVQFVDSFANIIWNNAGVSKTIKITISCSIRNKHTWKFPHC